MPEQQTWVEIDGGIATVGITEQAAAALGDVIHFEPPELGTDVVRGSSFCELESVKAISDVVAPVAGEVVEVNESVVSSPELVSDSPNSAWLVRIRIPEDAS